MRQRVELQGVQRGRKIESISELCQRLVCDLRQVTSPAPSKLGPCLPDLEVGERAFLYNCCILTYHSLTDLAVNTAGYSVLPQYTAVLYLIMEANSLNIEVNIYK